MIIITEALTAAIAKLVFDAVVQTGAGKLTEAAGKQLWQKIRGKVKEEGATEAVLAEVEKERSSEILEQKVVPFLQVAMQKYPEFAQEVQNILIIQSPQKLPEIERGISSVTASTNLITTPPNPRTWVGRKEEIGKIQAWLSNTAVNIIGIQGLGGIGKSALAAYLYNETSEFAARFWTDLSQKPDFVVFAEKTITALGGQVTQQGDITQLINDLLNSLNQHRCLLVVDNLETLLDESRQWQDSAYEQFFGRWVKQGDTSTLLLTTQEKPILLDTLFEPACCWYPLEGLNISDGAALLQKQGIQGTVRELEDFAKYVVDGHPLTLELVAGYLREYCNRQLSGARELGLEQFDLAYDKARGLHRDKKDVRLSWILQQHFQRLTSEQQRFLVDLSVYRQPFDYKAAELMLASEFEVKAVEVQEALRELFKRSLLLETQNGHYRFQPLVQRYAHQQATDLRPAHQKAITYYRSIAKEQPWQTIDDVKEYLEIFYHYYQLEDYNSAFNTIRTCDDFLTLRGYYTVQVEVYRQLVGAWEERVGETENSQNAICLKNLGVAYRMLNDYLKANEFLKRAKNLFSELNQREEKAWILYEIGLVKADEGLYDAAFVEYEKALHVFKELKVRQGMALAFEGIARVNVNRGELDGAIKIYRRIIQQFYSNSDAQNSKARRELAWIHFNLGHALLRKGEYKEAEECIEQGLSVFKELEDKNGIAWCCLARGDVILNRRFENEISCETSGPLLELNKQYNNASKTLELFRNDLKNKIGIAWTFHLLGRIEFQRGKFEEAGRYYREKLLIWKELDLNHPDGIAVVTEGFARFSTTRQQPMEQFLAPFLFGIAKTLREKANYPLRPSDDIEYKPELDKARNQLSEEDFLKAWRRGEETGKTLLDNKAKLFTFLLRRFPEDL